MAEITKPSGLNKIWAATGVISTPSDLKISTGNIVEKPAYDYFNFWQNRVDTFNAFMNQHGFPTWDANTEYQAEKSYVMHSNGTVYRCISTHTNQAIPNATYWEIAFADYGSSYTKVEADAKYLTRAKNLSDVSNVNTARTNLSVYSISQVDSLVAQATETVRGTAEVSTSAEAQALSSDTVMITPNKLDMAFKGSNQSLSSSGYQKLPGGLIIQWGSVSITAYSTATFTLPITFPTAGLAASATAIISDNTYALVSFPSTSQIRIKNVQGSGVETFKYIAIGY